MNRIDELMELAIAWARAECSVGEFRAAIEQELAEADGRGFTRGVKASRAAAQPQPEPVRTALEQYDLDQSPAYREGYEDGRRKGYEVGKRHAAQPQPEAVALTDADLLGAIARGWCSPANSHKTMDTDLAFAIAGEARAVLAAKGTK